MYMPMLKSQSLASWQTPVAQQYNKGCKAILHAALQLYSCVLSAVHLGTLACEWGNRQAQNGLRDGIIAEALPLGSTCPGLYLQAGTEDTYFSHKSEQHVTGPPWQAA